jgi:hypothetical protein
MSMFNSLEESDLMRCKCSLCNHDSRSDCITSGNCDCCNLEDIFSILSQHEFEPQSKVVTSKNRREYSINSSRF